ncbi:MAG TPA: hypothetical protein VIK01_18555 [Polyangiaceae bacterium]
MGISQIIFALLIMCGIGGYYYWKSGGRGGAEAYLTKLLALREGEKTVQTWVCFYDIERTMGEKVGEVFGKHTYGISLMLALTGQGRLVMGEMQKNRDGENNPPRAFEPGSVVVSLSDKKAERASLVGANGMENAVVMVLEPQNGQPAVKIQIAESGFKAIQAWAQF